MAKQGFNTIHVVCGMPGTGKSTFIEGDHGLGQPGLITVNTQPKKILYDFNNEYGHYQFITFDQLKRFKGSPKPKTMFDPDFEAYLQKLNSIPLCNALLVLEDSTAYIGHDVPKVIKENLAVMRHRNVDMIFTYHSVGLVQPKLISMATHITLFKTQEDNTGKRKLKQFPGLHAKWQKVKRAKDPHYNVTIRLK